MTVKIIAFCANIIFQFLSAVLTSEGISKGGLVLKRGPLTLDDGQSPNYGYQQP
jgi:hypothetical protein